MDKYASRPLLCLLQSILLAVTLLLVGTRAAAVGYETYLFWCRYGTLMAFISLACYVGVSGRPLTSGMLVLLSFVAFQFGIPILCGLIDGYSNYYMSFLSSTDLIEGTSYTVACMQAFALGMCLIHRGGSPGLRRLGEMDFLADTKTVEQAATLVFVLAAIVVFPRALLFLATSMASGIGVARETYELSGLENLGRGLFVPCGMLLLAYLGGCGKRRLVFVVMLAYAAVVTLSGDRTEGLTLAVALAFFALGMNWGRSGEDCGLKGLSRACATAAVAIALLWALVVVADIRVGGSASAMSLGDLVVSALDEMGFNSLTVCFQAQVSDEYSYGITYLSSITALVPTSLDFAGIKDLADAIDPTQQYYAAMGARYGWASFGLGYTLIAESYANFGFFGWPVLLLMGLAVGWLIQGTDESCFGRYLSLVFLWSFLTLPRRQASWLVNSFEYDFLFVLLLLWVWYSVAAVHAGRRLREGRGAGAASHGIWRVDG